MHVSMNVINFNKLKIKNFLSVGEDSVDVDFTPGLHIITGINKDKLDRRNGVGKSTIADAIHFAIFGTTIRELKKENISNNLTSGTCEVNLDFCICDNDNETNYKIVRTLEPSKCYLYVDGKDETRDSINNTTEHIHKLLSVTSDVFQNCVIMTLNNTIPFMGKKKVEKRKFIEGIFGLEVFGLMLSNLRAEHNDVKRDLDVDVGKYEEVQRSVDAATKRKDEFVTKRKDRITKLSNRKQSNLTKLSELKDQLIDVPVNTVPDAESKIKSALENIDKCEDKLTTINKKVSTLEAESKFKTQSLKKIGTTNEKCPVCLRAVSDHDRSHIDSEKSGLKSELDKISSNITKYRELLKKAQDVKTTLKLDHQRKVSGLNECKIKIREADSHKTNVAQLKSWNEEIDSELQTVNTETDQFDDSIKECRDRLDKLQLEVDNIKHRLSILDVVKFIVSEEGVKSYIVRKILQLFNSKLAYYLDKMDSNCICIFNEYFEEEIINEKGKVCSYNNFSGAERKNIDLACLFAFMDIRQLQGNAVYNFSVYDELLDTSLDERGVDLVLNILRERVEKYNECIMIISHRKESVKIGSHYKNTGNVIFLQKENGITRRVDFNE
jgi:DNA repair exonuclease SbcCD ATPase subunit